MAQLGEFGAELAVVDADPEEGPDTFLFHGHEFELPEKVSSLPALRFAFNAQQVSAAENRARAAQQRARSDEQRQAAAQLMAEVELTANAGLYQYLRDVLSTPGEWERFEQVAAEFGADETELLEVAQQIMAAVASRPTRRSSGSQAGPSTTGRTSTGDSDSRPASQPVEAATSGRAVVVVPELTPLELARVEIHESSASVAQLVRSGS